MIFLKKKHVIPKQGGGGGGPPLGKNSHIFPFFFGGASLNWLFLGVFPNKYYVSKAKTRFKDNFGLIVSYSIL